ncbi:MAG: hypothetical protein QOF80_594 [Verrucomicrobiota bacterium]
MPSGAVAFEAIRYGSDAPTAMGSPEDACLQISSITMRDRAPSGMKRPYAIADAWGTAERTSSSLKSSIVIQISAPINAMPTHINNRFSVRARICNWRVGDGGALCAFLLPAQGNDDFLVAAGEDDAAVFDRFDGQLIGLIPELKAELLAFLHRFAVDDGEAGALIHRD